MKRLMEWIVYHPALSVVLMIIVLTASSVKIKNLVIDASSEGMMVEGDPERDAYESFKKSFGSDTLTVVVIKSKNGDVFNTETLKTIDKLTGEFENIKGVTRVSSLTTVKNIKGEGDFVNTEKLIDTIPTSEHELDRVRRDTLQNYIFVKNLISKNGKTTAINIFTDNPDKDINFNSRISGTIDKIIATNKGALEIYQIGSPLVKVTFSSYIAGDQKTLIPLAVVFVMVTLLLSFTTPIGMVLPMITGILSIWSTFAFMTLMNYPINVITAIVPVLLIAVGCTEDVHMIAEYIEEIRAGKSKFDAVISMARKTALPILLTSSTTVIGFATIAFNNIPILVQFGIVSAFGLTANFIITIIVIPAALLFLDIPKNAIRERTEDSRQTRLIKKLMDSFMAMQERHGTLILVITGIIMVISVIGMFRIKVNTDFISYFKKGSKIRVMVDDINKNLSGALTFNILIDTKRENGAKNPELLQKVAMLQKYMESLGTIDKSVSLADYLMMMNKAMNGGSDEELKIPKTERLVAQYLLLLGESEIPNFVNNDYSKLNISVRHNITSSYDLTATLDNIKKYTAKTFSKDVKIDFTGEEVLINNAADSMAFNQTTSLLSTLAMIYVIMAMLFMSFKTGMISMIPNIIPIALNFGIMGWLNIPLNTGTCMVADVAIGIAVDDTIHFMVRFQKELMKTNSQREALHNTLHGEGEPVMSSSIALTLGFGILLFSNFNPTVDFGLLSVVTMITGPLADLIISPVILMRTQIVTIWDFISLKLDREVTKRSPIFLDFKHSEAKKVMLLGSLRNVAGGEYLIRQGESGNEMYMIVNGTVEVILNDKTEGKKTVASLNQGDLVGEMALLSSSIRFTDCICTKDTELLVIDEKALRRIQKRYPKIAAKLFFNISRILTDRLGRQMGAVSV